MATLKIESKRFAPEDEINHLLSLLVASRQIGGKLPLPDNDFENFSNAFSELINRLLGPKLQTGQLLPNLTVKQEKANFLLDAITAQLEELRNTLLSFGMQVQTATQLCVVKIASVLADSELRQENTSEFVETADKQLNALMNTPEAILAKITFLNQLDALTLQELTSLVPVLEDKIQSMESIQLSWHVHEVTKPFKARIARVFHLFNSEVQYDNNELTLTDLRYLLQRVSFQREVTEALAA